MDTEKPCLVPGSLLPLGETAARERRLELLIRQLPRRLQSVMRWLRQPSRHWARIPAGLLLILGGLLAVLPILGLWMLPLGVVLLSEDVKPLRQATNRMLAWIEHRRPRWMGLHPLPVRPSIAYEKNQHVH